MRDNEPFDERLAEALQSRAGSGSVSVAAAHEAVLTRAGHIRRRRAAGVGGIATIALLIGGVTLLPRGGSDTLAPGDTGDVLPSVGVDTSTTVSGVDDTTETGPGSTVLDREGGPDDDPSSDTIGSTIAPGVAPTTADTSATGTSTVGGAGTTGSGTTATPATTATSPVTTDDGGSSTSSAPNTSGPPSTDSSTSTSDVQTPPIAPFTKTYPSTGGSITVRWNGSAFSLLAVAPTAGFAPEIENDEPLRIRVRFRSDDSDSRIEVRVSDGVLVETIS